MHACFVCSVAAPDGHGRDDCGRDFSPDPSKQGTTGTEVPPTKAADRTLGLALRWGRAPGALRLPGLRCSTAPRMPAAPCASSLRTATPRDVGRAAFAGWTTAGRPALFAP